MKGVNGTNETTRRPIRKFNPGTFQSDEEVIRQFAVRKRELGIVLEVLGGNLDSPSCQHVLVVGPRGRGKTMLLARVAAELRTDRRLSESLFPVRFMEESQEIFNVADFWLEALYHLARETAERDPGLSGDLRKTYGDLSTRWAEGSLEARARAAVLEAVDRLDRRLVLMVENLQSLCEDVDDDFGWKLRQALQSEPQVMLLASATSRFEGLDDPGQPFFELFRNIILEPLTTEECRRLWQVVSGDPVSFREIRPLQILTGGNPRLLVIVAEFARHRSLRLLMEELVTLIDEHTEYFRGHLEILAKTERRVYVSVIDLWQPSSAGEIAVRARMDIRIVSTMLGRLVDRGALIVEGSGRKRQYAAAERIYSIYYKLRRERDEAAIVENLVKFMVVFYSGTELADMSNALVTEAAESTVIRTGISRALANPLRSEDTVSTAKWGIMRRVSEQALAKVQSSAEKELIETIDAALRTGAFIDVIETVERTVARPSTDCSQLSDPFIARILHAKADAQEKLGHSHAVVATCKQIVRRFGDDVSPDLQGHVAEAIMDISRMRKKLRDLVGAVGMCEEVSEMYGNSDVPDLQWWVAVALNYKGQIERELGKLAKAIGSFKEVFKRYGDSEVPSLRWWVSAALINTGSVKKEQGDLEGAVTAYEEVLGRYGDSDDSDLRWKVASALVGAGSVKKEQGDLDGAFALYEEVARRYGDSDDLDLQRRVADALMSMGRIKIELGDLRSSIAKYNEVVDRYGDSNTSELQIWVAVAMINAGSVKKEQGDLNGAITFFEQVMERFGGSEESGLQSWVAIALTEMGRAKQELGDLVGGVEAWDMVVKRYGDSEASVLQQRVALALIEKGRARKEQGDLEGAIAMWDKVVERYGERDVPDVQRWVILALTNKGMRQAEMSRGVEALSVCEEIDTKIQGLPETRDTRIQWAVQCIRALALMVQNKRESAMEAFHSAYTSFTYDDEISIREMLQTVPNLVAAGASERELVDILSSDPVKSAALTPLIVALRERHGEKVRAPAEVREVAADVREKIDDRVRSWPDVTAVSPRRGL